MHDGGCPVTGDLFRELKDRFGSACREDLGGYAEQDFNSQRLGHRSWPRQRQREPIRWPVGRRHAVHLRPAGVPVGGGGPHQYLACSTWTSPCRALALGGGTVWSVCTATQATSATGRQKPPA